VKKRSRNVATPDELGREFKELQQCVHKLQLQHAILVKVNELLQKDRGIDPRDLTNREKTLLIDALKASYRVRELIDALTMPRFELFLPCSPPAASRSLSGGP
jgi:putative transposase